MNALLNSAKGIGFRMAHRILDSIENTVDERSSEVLVNEILEKRVGTGRKSVLYVGIRYDYGDKRQGLSYEHHNFYNTLQNMDLDLIYVDYDRLSRTYGKKKMNEVLRDAAFYYKPDYLFYFHYKDWVEHDIWTDISTDLPTRTIIWLADDHWRYEETKGVWGLFDVVATTDHDGLKKRTEAGMKNVILSQWACNHYLYNDMDVERTYDVSFVGRSYGKRKEFVDILRSKGIDVKTFGEGWEGSGRISQSDMIRIYNKSKITLNISFAGKGERPQIKGRDFEAPGCGAMSVTKNVAGLEDYFVPGKEIVTYEDVDDAAEKILFYLKNDELRRQIATAGHERTLKDHTFEKRLADMFAFSDSVKNIAREK